MLFKSWFLCELFQNRLLSMLITSITFPSVFFTDLAVEDKSKNRIPLHQSCYQHLPDPLSMLSYIIPVDSSKQSQKDSSLATTDHHDHHLQLSLIHGRCANGNATTTVTTPISKETSVSSFASDGTTATISHNTSSSMTNTSASDRHKTTKIIINGKHQPLKR